MLKMGICWCKLGMMAQCTAESVDQQEMCDFYDSSIGVHKCMNLNTSMRNHCWSKDAQKFSAQYGVRDMNNPAPVAEEELCIDDFIEDEAPEGEFNGRRCDNCILYACSYVIHENQMAQSRGGLTMSDLEKIAAKCSDYCDEATINASVQAIQRGTRP